MDQNRLQIGLPDYCCRGHTLRESVFRLLSVCVEIVIAIVFIFDQFPSGC